MGVDPRQGGRDAIALAKQLAPADARLTLAHAYGIGLMAGRAATLLLGSQLEEAQRLLKQRRADASLDARLAVCAERSAGRALQRLAESSQASLLVVGSCHRGLLGRVLLGDDTSAALNGAPCAVAIAPSGYTATAHRLSTVGVGCDGSPESEQALATAREIAARCRSTIKALSVVSLQSIPYGEPIPESWPVIARELVDDELRRLHGLEDVEGDVTYGDPGEELAAFSGELDLLIIGSRGYGPFGRLFNGSTSNYLARRARCPLLVLPRSAASGDERLDAVPGQVRRARFLT